MPRFWLTIVLTMAALGEPCAGGATGARVAGQDPLGAATIDFGQPAQWDASPALPRESSTQLMMLDIIDVEVPGARVAEAGAPAGGAGPWSRLWSVLAQATQPWLASSAVAARRGFAPGIWLDPLRGGRQGVTRAARVHAYLTSLGTSTGEAFDIEIVNDGTMPVRLGGDGVVIEPVKNGSDKALRAELRQIASRQAASTSVKGNAYCLEFKLNPPERGTMFRVSNAATQQKYTAAREILRASRRLQQSGQLQPDSDARDYFHAIRQWAIWTTEQRFTLASYRDAFVERSKRNVQAMRLQWSRQVEDGLKALVPHRWDEIAKILREAGQPVPGA